jgi:hypothetical protein
MESHEFSESPPVHRRMEEEYVQEHILTDSIVIVAPVGGCLTSSRCLAIGPYTFNEVRCIRPILLNRKNALFAGLGSTNDESRQLTAVTGHRRPRIRAPLYGSAGGLQSWFGDLRSTTATDLDAALLRSRQRRLCALRNHSGRVRQRPLTHSNSQRALESEQELSHQSFVLRRRSDCRPRGWSAALSREG